jgi:hypothetical protein
MILLVTYDLKGPTGFYAKLFETLKAEAGWWHYLSSTWLIDTEENSAKDFFAKIRPHIRKGDRVFVVEIVEGYYGWLPEKAWAWLKNHGVKP